MKNITPTLLVYIGIISCFFGIFLVMMEAAILSNQDSSTGIIIFIGPIPIVFGSGKYGFELIIIDLLIIIVITFLTYIYVKRKI